MAGTDTQPWINHISAYEREFKKWTTRSEKIIDRYRDDKRGTNATSRFNILWSNVQTLVPATFGRLPQPDVSRRFRDNDPVGRVAALILERALDFELQHYKDYRNTLKSCVYDRFLGGRGTAWARYEPHIRAKAKEPEDGVEVTEDVDVEEELQYECAPVDYVHWKDFGHTVARTWEEVTAVWRKVYMTRAGCIERFGKDEGEKIPLDARPDDQKNKTQAENEQCRALVYEIWDKESKKALWLSKSLGKFLDEKDDPLGLQDFFPCPKPLFATLTNDTLVPVPDYVLYQDQADQLNVLSDRIEGLITMLQVKGVYNAEFAVLARLFTEGENGKMFPIKDFAAFAEKQGLKGAMDIVELKPIYEALLAAYKAVEELKTQIYDITGLSDIVRGSSEASETATAQQIKGQYASMRLNSMKHDVAQFATEVIQLKAQIMTGKFDQQTLLEIGGAGQLTVEDQQAIPKAMELLKNNAMRQFRIDIAADSLVQMDESQEKQDRMEMITAVGQALKNAEPVVQSAPELAPMVIELIKFGVSSFKIGKTVEGTIDQALDQMKQSIKAKQGQPPPPNPEMVKIQAEQQAAQAKLQADQAAEQQRLQHEAALEQQRQQAEDRRQQHQALMDQHRNMMEDQRAQNQASMDAAFERFKALLAAQTTLKKTEADNETKIEVAEIAAGATLDAAQISAANAGAED